MGLINQEEYESMRVLLQKNWGETCLPDIELDDFLALLRKDKKAIGKEINVILTKGLGKMFKTPLPITPEVEAWLSDCLNSFKAASARQ